MEIGQSSKIYGLSFPTRAPKNESKKSVQSVFNDESDEEQKESSFKPLDSSKSKAYQARINRKTKSDLEKALEEDPSIFQYDEVLDDIHTQKDKEFSDMFSKAQRESKYVGKLIKSASVRKLERELCAERKAKKEIEAEAELYKDKESFVTSAYKEKLGELRELVEKRKEEESREGIMDITKQDGLGGFYRYMFEQETDRERDTELIEKEKRVPTDQPEHTFRDPGIHGVKRQHRNHPSSNSNIRDEQKKTEHQNENDESPQHESLSSTQDMNSNIKTVVQKVELDAKEGFKQPRKPQPSMVENVNKPDFGPGFIAARPRITTDDELEAARERYLARKAAGIHALIVESD